MQSYNAIATIGLAENLCIVTCLGVNLFIPCERLTEICSKLCLNILALISNFAILCQVHCHDTIATCHSNEGLVIISCLSIDNTIPIVLLTECSIKLTIYSYALWILWALLGQVQSHNAIATTCQWEGLNIITCYCIFYAVPNIWILAELSTKLCLNILAHWSIWSYRDSINSSELHEHAALFLINQSSELVVGYLYSSHASKHIVLVCSYRSSVLAVSINLRNDSNSIVVNIVINEEVDYILVIQTCNIQLVECIQLYIRQFHHLPIQYRNVCALFWAARLIWCWIIWIDDSLVIYTDCHIACSAEACIARQVAQIIAILFDHLSYLLRFNAYDDRIQRTNLIFLNH